jgi:hypothetical protein
MRLGGARERKSRRLRMNQFRTVRIVVLFIGLVSAAGAWGCLLDLAAAAQAQTDPQAAPAPSQQNRALVIENDSQLPDTYPHGQYYVRLQARHGGLHWRVLKGALPPGIRLEDDGLLHGEPERTGEFQFTVSVMEAGKPEQAVQKQFVIRVRSALSLNWKSPAHVNGNRVEGSVEVTNTTPDDIDLTFIVLAVPGNGRATAIGYQHFVLPRGTVQKELPFGDTLPRGGYLVHVDAIGEVEAKNLIYRERMVTPHPLVVNVGP